MRREFNAETAPAGKGVRRLTVEDQLPDCEVFVNRDNYDLREVCAGKKVVDIGCGYGRNRAVVEGVGGSWTGVEPFAEPAGHMVVAPAENLPFDDASFDVAIMDAVLEHVEDVDLSMKEVARVLRPGGIFVGYSAFMECFHEISYSHLSYMALQYYARKYGMTLKSISGGRRFGIDYAIHITLYPLPVQWARPMMAATIRGITRVKSWLVYLAMRFARRASTEAAKRKADAYYTVECIRQSVGFGFVMQKA
jgi:ubiquinone/menaquinone biosynthesis C-methylase UbiE